MLSSVGVGVDVAIGVGFTSRSVPDREVASVLQLQTNPGKCETISNETKTCLMSIEQHSIETLVNEEETRTKATITSPTTTTTEVRKSSWFWDHSDIDRTQYYNHNKHMNQSYLLTLTFVLIQYLSTGILL